MDIDAILERAETQESQSVGGAGEELLSQFNVANFSTMDDDDTSLDEPGRDWDDIIPEQSRSKMEEEDKQREQLELYLPPRVRKQVQRVSDENIWNFLSFIVKQKLSTSLGILTLDRVACQD